MNIYIKCECRGVGGILRGARKQSSIWYVAGRVGDGSSWIGILLLKKFPKHQATPIWLYPPGGSSPIELQIKCQQSQTQYPT